MWLLAVGCNIRHFGESQEIATGFPDFNPESSKFKFQYPIGTGRIHELGTEICQANFASGISAQSTPPCIPRGASLPLN